MGGAIRIARALRSSPAPQRGADWPRPREGVAQAIPSLSVPDYTYARTSSRSARILSLRSGRVRGVAMAHLLRVFADNAPSFNVMDAGERSTDTGRRTLSVGATKQMVKDELMDSSGCPITTRSCARGLRLWLLPPKRVLCEGDTFTFLQPIDTSSRVPRRAARCGGAARRRGEPRTTSSAPPQGRAGTSMKRRNLWDRSRGPFHARPSPHRLAPAARRFRSARAMVVTPTMARRQPHPNVRFAGVRASRRACERCASWRASDRWNAVTALWWRWKDVDTYPVDVIFKVHVSRPRLQVPNTRHEHTSTVLGDRRRSPPSPYLRRRCCEALTCRPTRLVILERLRWRHSGHVATTPLGRTSRRPVGEASSRSIRRSSTSTDLCRSR